MQSDNKADEYDHQIQHLKYAEPLKLNRKTTTALAAGAALGRKIYLEIRKRFIYNMSINILYHCQSERGMKSMNINDIPCWSFYVLVATLITWYSDGGWHKLADYSEQ